MDNLAPAQFFLLTCCVTAGKQALSEPQFPFHVTLSGLLPAILPPPVPPAHWLPEGPPNSLARSLPCWETAQGHPSPVPGPGFEVLRSGAQSAMPACFPPPLLPGLQEKQGFLLSLCPPRLSTFTSQCQCPLQEALLHHRPARIDASPAPTASVLSSRTALTEAFQNWLRAPGGLRMAVSGTRGGTTGRPAPGATVSTVCDERTQGPGHRSQARKFRGLLIQEPQLHKSRTGCSQQRPAGILSPTKAGHNSTPPHRPEGPALGPACCFLPSCSPHSSQGALKISIRPHPSQN